MLVACLKEKSFNNTNTMLVIPLMVITIIIIEALHGAPLAGPHDNEESIVEVDGELIGEYGDKFEGDMVLNVEQRQALELRNGLINATKRWPDKTFVYDIIDDHFDEPQKKMLLVAMDDISNKTCIKFRQRNEEEHSVTIRGDKNGCFSNVGYALPDQRDDGQVVNLAAGCMQHGIIVHEYLHTLGFYHMQSTHDRDNYVRIVWDNIKEGVEHNFNKYDNNTVTDFGIPYDYNSIMHYGPQAFSKNGQATIEPLDGNAKIGQRKGLSEQDILKINKMYCDQRI